MTKENPYAEFGGTPLTSKTKEDNPYAEFGGTPVATKPVEDNPYAEFGGIPISATEPSTETLPPNMVVVNGQKRQLMPPLSQQPQPAQLNQPNQDESGKVSMQELDSILRKPGLTPDEQKELKEVMPYLGVSIEGTASPVSDTVKQGVGTVFPLRDEVWGVKKLGRSDAYKQAMDELSELAHQRRTWTTAGVQLASQLVTGGAGLKAVGAGIKAVGLTGKAAKAAELGATIAGAATQGSLTSSEGSKVVGAGIGAGLVSGMAAAAKLPPRVRQAIFGGGLAGVGTLVAQGRDKDEDGDLLQRTLKNTALGTIAAPLLGISISKLAPRHVKEETAAKAAKLIADSTESRAARVEALDDYLRLKTIGSAKGVDDLVEAERNMLEYEAPFLQTPKTATALMGSVEASQEAISQAARPSDLDMVALATRLGAEGITRIGDAENYLQTVGKERLASTYDAFLREKDIALAFSDDVARHFTVDKSWFHTAARLFQRAPGAAGIIDDRSGGLIQAEKAVIDHTEATQRAQNFTTTFLDKYKDVAKVHSVQVSPVIQDAWASGGAEAAIKAGATDKQLESLREFSKVFEDAATQFNLLKKGSVKLKEALIGRYIPREYDDVKDIITTAHNLARQVGGKLEDSEELLKVLAHLKGDWDNIYTKRDIPSIYGAFKEVTEPAALEGIISKRLYEQRTLGLNMKRAEVSGIPNSIRQKNLGKLGYNYVNSLSQEIHTREAKADLVHQIEKMKAIGDYEGADWAMKHLQSITTGLPGPKTYINKKANQLLGSMAASPKSYVRATARILPDLMDSSGKWLYANLTGFGSPSNLLKTTASNWTGVGAELGSAGNVVWGQEIATKAFLQASKEATEGLGSVMTSGSPIYNLSRLKGFGQTIELMQKKGMLPTSTSQEAVDNILRSVVQGVEDVGAIERNFRRFYVEMGNDLAETAMTVDKVSETISRLTAYKSAENVLEQALDMSHAGENARNFISKIGRGYREVIEKDLQLLRAAPDSPAVRERLQDNLSSYLIGRSIHFYSAEHQAMFAKYLGRWSAAFSTWPTATATDLLRRIYASPEGGYELEVVRRYLGPLFLLKALDRGADAWQGDDDTGARGRIKAAIGQEGLAGASPVGDMSRVFAIETPYTKAPAQALKSLSQGDSVSKTLQKAMVEPSLTFTPFGLVDTLLKRTISLKEIIKGNDIPRGLTPISGRVHYLRTGEKAGTDDNWIDELTRD